MRFHNFFAFLLVAILLLPLALTSEETAVPSLPPDAQEALKRGLLAADQKEWDLAGRYFQVAHKAAPMAPEILFNLGLAESKMPGRELRSIAWFRAYLAVSPSAPNAEAVRKQISTLEIAVEATMQKLIAQAKTLAGQYQDDYDKKSRYNWVAAAQARTGDAVGALQTAELGGNDSSTLEQIAVAQAENGDFDGAKRTVNRMKYDETVYNSSAYQRIAVLQANAGDTIGAEVTLSMGKRSDYRHEGFVAIARAQMKTGKKQEAFATLAKAYEFLKKAQADDTLGFASDTYNVACVQAEIGDYDGARRTSWLLREKDDKWYKQTIISNIAEARSKEAQKKLDAGDFQGALSIAWQIDVPDIQASLLYNLISDRIKAADYSQCSSLIDRIDDANRSKAQVYAMLANALLKAGDETQARAVLARAAKSISKMNPQYMAYLFEPFLQIKDLPSVVQIANRLSKQSEISVYTLRDIAKAQAAAGDIKGALQTASTIKDDYYKRDSLTAIGSAQVAAGDLKGAKVTVAAITDDSSKTTVLREICKAQIAKKDFKGAKLTASGISDDYYKSGILEEVLKDQLEKKDFKSALQTAGEMTHKQKKDSAYASIANAQMGKGDLAEAKRTANFIEAPDSRSDILAKVAKKEADDAGIPAALETIKTFPQDSRKVYSYCELAGLKSSVGDIKGAREILALAIGAADSIKDGKAKVSAYAGTIANSFLGIGDLVEARRLLTLAEAAAATIADPYQHSSACAPDWSSTFYNERELGLPAEARESLWLALENARLMKEDNYSKHSCLSTIARAMAERGDFSGAFELARSIPDDGYRSYALSYVAQVFANCGNIKAALETTSGLSLKSSQMASVLQTVGCKQAELGDLAAARTTAQQMAEGSPRDSVYEAIALACLKANDNSGARAAIARRQSTPSYTLCEAMTKAGEIQWAEETLAKLKGEWEKNYFHAYIASAKAAKGDVAGAKAMAMQLSETDYPYYRSQVARAIAGAGDVTWATDYAKKIKDDYYQLDALINIATVQIEKGDAAAGRKLLETVTKGKLATNRMPWVAGVLVRAGDAAAARKMLESLRSDDPDFDSWVAYMTMSYENLADAKQAADAIPNTRWRSFIYSSIAWQLQTKPKDKAAAIELAKTIPDPLIKSQYFIQKARTLTKEANLKDALGMADLISDTGMKAQIIAEINAVAIGTGNLAVTLPSLASLPDGAIKTYLCTDLASAQQTAGDSKSAVASLEAAQSSASAMPAGFWKAKALGCIVSVATLAADAKFLESATAAAKSAADALSADDKRRMETPATPVATPAPGKVTDTAKPSAPAAQAAPAAESEAAKKVREMVEGISKKLVDGDLSKPLYTDFQAELKSISSQPKPDDILSGINRAATELAKTLKDLR